jgi:PTS system ascorbate-specific IIA component
MGILADAFGEGSILIKDSVENRSSAISLVGDLLVSSGKATSTYVASMLEAVEIFGPYIVIAPGIALAHGKPSDAVLETGLSLLILEQSIEFQHSQNDPVRLVFGLAATDHESHLELMAELAEFLSAQENVSSLLRCSDSEQVLSLLG